MLLNRTPRMLEDSVEWKVSHASTLLFAFSRGRCTVSFPSHHIFTTHAGGR